MKTVTILLLVTALLLFISTPNLALDKIDSNPNTLEQTKTKVSNNTVTSPKTKVTGRISVLLVNSKYANTILGLVKVTKRSRFRKWYHYKLEGTDEIYKSDFKMIGLPDLRKRKNNVRKYQRVWKA